MVEPAGNLNRQPLQPEPDKSRGLRGIDGGKQVNGDGKIPALDEIHARQAEQNMQNPYKDDIELDEPILDKIPAPGDYVEVRGTFAGREYTISGNIGQVAPDRSFNIVSEDGKARFKPIQGGITDRFTESEIVTIQAPEVKAEPAAPKPQTIDQATEDLEGSPQNPYQGELAAKSMDAAAAKLEPTPTGMPESAFAKQSYGEVELGESEQVGEIQQRIDDVQTQLDQIAAKGRFGRLLAKGRTNRLNTELYALRQELAEAQGQATVATGQPHEMAPGKRAVADARERTSRKFDM